MHIPDYIIIIITGIVIIGIFVGLFYIYLSSKDRGPESYPHFMSPCRMADYLEAKEKLSFTKSLIDGKLHSADTHVEIVINNMPGFSPEKPSLIERFDYPEMLYHDYVELAQKLYDAKHMVKIVLHTFDNNGIETHSHLLGTVGKHGEGWDEKTYASLISDTEEWLRGFIRDQWDTGLNYLIRSIKKGGNWFDEWSERYDFSAEGKGLEFNRMHPYGFTAQYNPKNNKFYINEQHHERTEKTC